MYTRIASLVVLGLIWAGPTFAHHSFAMFDYNKDMTLNGEVKVLRWTNPHIHLIVSVPDGKGGTAEWDVEGGTPNNLRKTGWSKDVVAPGDKIAVAIHPMKNGSTGGQLVRVNRADGTLVGTAGAQ